MTESNMFTQIVNASNSMTDFFKKASELFTMIFSTPITQLVNKINVPIIGDIIRWIVDLIGQIGLPLGGLTLFTLMFTTGITTWIVITLVKWLRIS